jgi:hypothetical protein
MTDLVVLLAACGMWFMLGLLVGIAVTPRWPPLA